MSEDHSGFILYLKLTKKIASLKDHGIDIVCSYSDYYHNYDWYHISLLLVCKAAQFTSEDTAIITSHLYIMLRIQMNLLNVKKQATIKSECAKYISSYLIVSESDST